MPITYVPPIASGYLAEVDRRLWDILGGEVRLADSRGTAEEVAVELVFARAWLGARERNVEAFEQMFESCDFQEGRVYDNQQKALAFFRGLADEAGISLWNFLFSMPNEFEELFDIQNAADMATALCLRGAPVGALRVLADVKGRPLRAEYGLSLARLADTGRSLTVYARSVSGLEHAGVYLERGISSHVFKALDASKERIVIAAAMRRVDPMYAVGAVAHGVTDLDVIAEGWSRGQVSPEYLAALSSDEQPVV